MQKDEIIALIRHYKGIIAVLQGILDRQNADESERRRAMVVKASFTEVKHIKFSP